MPFRLSDDATEAPVCKDCPGALSWTGGPENACGDDAPVLRLQDFHGNPRQLDTNTRFGNILKVFQNEPVKRFRAIQRELQVEHAVDVSQLSRSFDDDAAVGSPI